MMNGHRFLRAIAHRRSTINTSHFLVLIAAFGLTSLTIGCEGTDWASFAVDLFFDSEYTLSLTAPDTVLAPTLPVNVRVIATLSWAGLPVRGAFVRADNHCFLTGESGRANCDVSFHDYGRIHVEADALDSTQMTVASADKWIVIAPQSNLTGGTRNVISISP